MIDIIKAWLKNFPGWKECTWFTDYLDPIPGCVGVFPHGCQALEEQSDITGVKKIRQRWEFAIYRVVSLWGDREKAAREAEDFQKWIQQTPSPVFGEDQKVEAKKGHLFQVRQQGESVYALRLSIEFTKLIEVI